MFRNLARPVLILCSLLIFSFEQSCKKTSADPDNAVSITSISPLIAKGGDLVTVFGKNLLKDRQSLQVSVNRKNAEIINTANDSLQFVVPEKAGTGSVVITEGAMSYAGPELKYDFVADVTTIAGSGIVGKLEGTGVNAQFNCPWGIAIDKNGDLYVADSYNRLIRKISAPTNYVSNIDIPTYVKDSLFFSPYNIAIDTNSQSLYLTDFNEHLMKVTSTGDETVIFTHPMPLAGIGLGPDGKLYVSNNTTGEVLQLDTTGENEIVYGSGLVTPRNIVFDNQRRMFVAGLGIYQFTGMGSAYQLMPNPNLFHGWEIAVDSSGNFYEADHFNNLIRKIDKDQNITIIAGNGTAADIDGVGTDASFNGPMGICIDKDGNLYVTTYNFSDATGNKVRKITFH